MNRHVNAISGRLSLRPPQRHSLDILHRITEIAPPKKDSCSKELLEAIRKSFRRLRTSSGILRRSALRSRRVSVRRG